VDDLCWAYQVEELLIVARHLVGLKAICLLECGRCNIDDMNNQHLDPAQRGALVVDAYPIGCLEFITDFDVTCKAFAFQATTYLRSIAMERQGRTYCEKILVHSSDGVAA
jgi:hypothetical protein